MRWAQPRHIPAAACLLVAVALAAPRVHADGDAQSRIAIGVGALHLQLHDDVVRGRRWSGPGMAFVSSFEHATDRDLHRVELRLPLAFIGNRHEHAGNLEGFDPLARRIIDAIRD